MRDALAEGQELSRRLTTALRACSPEQVETLKGLQADLEHGMTQQSDAERELRAVNAAVLAELGPHVPKARGAGK